jgi:hypothetical protein
MDYSPLISKIVIPSSPPTSPTTQNTERSNTANCSFEAALAQVHDEETGALIPAAFNAGDNEPIGATVDVPLDSVPPMVAVKDVEKVKNTREAWKVFVKESKVLWAIAAPIAFNIICLYGMNSSTQIFVGHVGNLELSAVAVGLSVVSNFSFGFLVSKF